MQFGDKVLVKNNQKIAVITKIRQDRTTKHKELGINRHGSIQIRYDNILKPFDGYIFVGSAMVVGLDTPQTFTNDSLLSQRELLGEWVYPEEIILIENEDMVSNLYG